MFEENELSARLSQNKTQLKLTVTEEQMPADKYNRQASFKRLAIFINNTPDCRELQILFTFEMSLNSWTDLGRELANTKLYALDLQGNLLGNERDEKLPNWRINAFMDSLIANQTLYLLDVRNTHLDRICITHLKKEILKRPFWLSVLATQRTLTPPTCSFVDDGVAENRENIVQFVISIAQAAVTTHPVDDETGKLRDYLKTLCSSQKDVITYLTQHLFFPSQHHPMNQRIAGFFPKAFAIAKAHQQTTKIEAARPTSGCIIC